jgi:hypothetical protein
MHGLWIITFVFGVIASVIAYSKGRNSLGWFLAGMFVGPFALVVAFLPPISKDGMYVTCPSCCEVIREQAGTCRYCRALVERSERL